MIKEGWSRKEQKGKTQGKKGGGRKERTPGRNIK